jgi:hypothetical protein
MIPCLEQTTDTEKHDSKANINIAYTRWDQVPYFADLTL